MSLPPKLTEMYEQSKDNRAELALCQEYFIELAVEQSEMKDAKEVLNRIASK